MTWRCAMDLGAGNVATATAAALLLLLSSLIAAASGAAMGVVVGEASGVASNNELLSARLRRECSTGQPMSCVYSEAAAVLRTLFAEDKVRLFPGVTLRRQGKEAEGATRVHDPRGSEVADVEYFLVDELARYASSRALQLDVSRLAAPAAAATANARVMISSFIRWPSIWDFIKVPNFLKPSVTGKSSFLTGFGLGFLAFGLKKLLLPIIIGGQIVKSVLIAMFLPSILGGLGKLVGKGVSTFASASGSSGGLSGALSGGAGGGGVDDFGDFKDPGGGYGDTDTAGSDAFTNTFMYPDAPQYGVNGVSQPGNANANVDSNTISRMPGLGTGATALYVPNKFQAQSKVSHHQPLEHFYTRNKQQDFKVFHQIPASSLLLTHYDPFYSPLLSRLDSVFTQLGYTSEACRERLICAMYSNPARFAPYSNLVSAQLSRELNELRKPSSDNPEILRFFRYMKAAKDGQDGLDCFALHPGCVVADGGNGAAKSPGTGELGSPPMLKTYHDINKLVQARRLGRRLRLEPVAGSEPRTTVGRGGSFNAPAFVPIPVAERESREEEQKDSAPVSVPSSVPISRPTAIPTSIPTSVPTSGPVPSPPTLVPPSVPTSFPTSVPASLPSSVPTSIPTSFPTSVPTSLPSSVPPSLPTSIPTFIPIHNAAQQDNKVASPSSATSFSATPAAGNEEKKQSVPEVGERGSETAVDEAPREEARRSDNDGRWIPRTDHARTEEWRPINRDDAKRSSGDAQPAEGDLTEGGVA